MSKELKIQTGVVKRVNKELASYHKEAKTQQARIDKLVADGGDEYDVKKQKEVLEETNMMIPDCKKRLEAAVQNLKGLLDNYLKNTPGVSEESEEVKAAREVLADVSL